MMTRLKAVVVSINAAGIMEVLESAGFEITLIGQQEWPRHCEELRRANVVLIDEIPDANEPALQKINDDLEDYLISRSEGQRRIGPINVILEGDNDRHVESSQSLSGFFFPHHFSAPLRPFIEEIECACRGRETLAAAS